ncbi:hypothetical protein IMZ48_16010 [Candidatus Bathyarchaeota archaeon]|nr:hypothetical protein [Candidatus Bathyarchaeota archaeon]
MRPDVAGEVVRQDVVDGEEGVPLAVDVQAVDVETCEPIPGAYFEIWREAAPIFPAKAPLV